MRPSFFRTGLAGVCVLSLAAGLAGCGGGGGSSAIAPAPSSFSLAAARYSLGFLAATPQEIARLPQIRHLESTSPLPTSADLSAYMPPVGNQGGEGSCVAWASGYAMRGYEARRDVWSADNPKSGSPALNFSAAFIYNQINGGRDAGSTIPAALTLMQTKGAATLADMPYVDGQYVARPSAAAFSDAANYKLGSYGQIAPGDLTTIKTQLSRGIPVILAIKVYANFFGLGANQVYSAPAGPYEGGHALTIVGYNDAKGALEVINSWGTYWGTLGYGWISYAAFNKIAVEAYAAIDAHGAPKK